MEQVRNAIASMKNNPDGIAGVFRAACHDIVDNVGSTRASIWFFNNARSAITCEALYDIRTKEYSSGAVLKDEDFHDYFEAIQNDSYLVAPDAANHPGTKCFDDLYFIPNDISSLLDYIVKADGVSVAVLCCEHCGEIKNWSEKDKAYLQQLSGVLGMAIKMRGGAK